jgi:2-keto-4-pentenoate hydratase/2-oxohepta-3-ene-1,7-dioic acid hydratase in catechol pathway
VSALRIVLFGDGRLGLATAGGVVATDADGAWSGAHALGRLIRDFDAQRPHLQRCCDFGPVLPGTDATLRAPLARPAKVLAAMRARTAGAGSPTELHVYLKSNSAITADRSEIVLPDAEGAALFTHNGCLAVVIGRRTHALPALRWREAVFGYTAMIDVIARTQAGTRWKDGRSCLGGSFETFAPLGPWIVPRTEMDDESVMAVQLRVNGTVRQDDRLDVDREIGETIALASSVMTLHPGDVIAIPGRADAQGPLQHGDRVELDVGPVGPLRATVSDPLRRRWPTDLRLDASADDTDVRVLVR